MTLDHVIPRSRGGTDQSSNLVTACRRCNTKKANGIYMKKSNGKIYRIMTSEKSIERLLASQSKREQGEEVGR